MFNFLASGAGDAGAGVDLVRGAIVGAFFIGASFLAGVAVFRRGAMATCAFLMVAAAGVLELGWLGFFPKLPPEIIVLLQGVFAASAIVFLSSAIGAAKNNALLGGAMFAAAITLIGIGIINFFGRIDTSGLMQLGLAGVAGFGVLLAVIQAAKGDTGARLILPGALLGAAAIAAFKFSGAGVESLNLAPHALFTMAVLVASLVAVMETGAGGSSYNPQGAETAAAFSFAEQVDEFDGPEGRSTRHHTHQSSSMSDEQLCKVLDYSGLAVWDWTPRSADQTASLHTMLGADSDASFTPEALRAFIHNEDVATFDKEITDASSGDGGFDVVLKLHNDNPVRIRGARAVDGSGELERLVAFIEPCSPGSAGASQPDMLQLSGKDLDRSQFKKANSAAAAALIAPVMHSQGAKFGKALEDGKITAAFQPIIDLESNEIAGYEALARWRDEKDEGGLSPEEMVRAAESAGKGGIFAAVMMEEAGAFLSEKLKKKSKGEAPFVALNASYGQLRDKGFIEAVTKTIKKFKIPEGRLVLELTESQAITDTVEAGKLFKQLKNAGAALAFDDFGAGFSSLSNLHLFDFDYLKIDKSFIQPLQDNGDAAKIARSMAQLGADLGLQVIAEGIESKELAGAVKDLGCVYGQGFALGAPTVEKKAKKSDASKKALSLKSEDRVEDDGEPPEKPNRWRLWGGEMR